MSTLAVLKTDGNIRNNYGNNNKINKVVKSGPPKIRLRLDEAVENQKKAVQTDAKYSLNPPNDSFYISNLIKKNEKRTDYLHEELVNRNKICQMNKIMFPEKNDSFLQEKQGPRCLGDDSLSYLTRNRGSMILMGNGFCGNFQDTSANVRCPSSEAVDNLEKGRGSRMMNVLQHSTDHREIHPSPRLRDEEAAEIYKKHHSGSMANVLNHTRQVQSAVIREPRCPTSEARETWENSLGRSMLSVMSRSQINEDSGNQVSSKKKVKDEDGNEIDPSNSSGMSYVLKHSGDGFTTPLSQQRVKWEGEEIALKNRGTLTSDIYNYNKNINEIQAVPRVRPEAQEFANANRGLATKNLMMKYGKLPGDSKPKAHINRYSMKIAMQSQGGTMKDALCPPRQAHSKHSRVRSAHR